MIEGGADGVLERRRAVDWFDVRADALFRQDHAAEFVSIGGPSMNDALQPFHLVVMKVRDLPVDKRADEFR
jgi:hypothetical protein